jgi:hypothetical protein
MATKILMRRDTAANWSVNNPVLSLGEIGYDLTSNQIKLGDGTTTWNNLGYLNSDAVDIVYNNTTSQLTATNAQTAIDEVEGRLDTAESDITTHIDATNNPHSVTAEQVGLGNVTNESKETMFTDPTFTGTVSGVTATMVGLGNVTNESKETMFTNAALTGVPTAPTPAASTNTTQIATAAFVQSEINSAALALGTNFSVADIAARDSLQNLVVGDVVFVADDGDGKWAQYKVTAIGPFTFLKIMDQDIFLNALSAADVKAAYESNADTNAFTDLFKTRLENTGTNYLVADNTEAINLENLVLGDIVYINDTGDGKWAIYMVFDNPDPELDFFLGPIMTESIFTNAISNQSIKDAYEGNQDTNAFTDELLTKLNEIEENAKDDQDADEVPFDNNVIQVTATNVQQAIDSLYTDIIRSHIDDSTVHFTQEEISITESQISDLQNYEPADATILKVADINVTVQAYNADTVIDANYQTFDASGDFENLRARATTATDVGLENVTNESKATMFTDAALTGIPTAPTADVSTNTTQIATTAFVQALLAGAQTIDGGEF